MKLDYIDGSPAGGDTLEATHTLKMLPRLLHPITLIVTTVGLVLGIFASRTMNDPLPAVGGVLLGLVLGLLSQSLIGERSTNRDPVRFGRVAKIVMITLSVIGIPLAIAWGFLIVSPAEGKGYLVGPLLGFSALWVLIGTFIGLTLGASMTSDASTSRRKGIRKGPRGNCKACDGIGSHIVRGVEKACHNCSGSGSVSA